jgi:hypothetical protein
VITSWMPRQFSRHDTLASTAAGTGTVAGGGAVVRELTCLVEIIDWVAVNVCIGANPSYQPDWITLDVSTDLRVIVSEVVVMWRR